jgi:hypothetical protein
LGLEILVIEIQACFVGEDVIGIWIGFGRIAAVELIRTILLMLNICRYLQKSSMMKAQCIPQSTILFYSRGKKHEDFIFLLLARVVQEERRTF